MLSWLKSLLGGNKALWGKLSISEAKHAREHHAIHWESVLDVRHGRAKKVIGAESPYDKQLTDADIERIIEYARLMDAAREAGDSGSHKKAVQLYEQLLQLDPTNSIAMMSLGVCYAYLHQGTKAVEHLEEALRLDPSNRRIEGNLQAIKEEFRL
jgi:Flp pilus assembly protein TadD